MIIERQSSIIPHVLPFHLAAPLISWLFSWQRHHHFNIIVGEISCSASNAPLQPVFINSTDQGDDVALVESQLTFVLWIKVIEGFTARLCSRKTQNSEEMKEGGRTNTVSL